MALLFLQACNLPARGAISQVCFDHECFKVEIARTPEERARGLQGRASMDKGHGMLFIFEASGRHGFWMKETLIPLDMLWLDAGGKVVSIASEAQPCTAGPCPSYYPQGDAVYVLEISGGLARALGLKTGDQAVFK